MIARLTLTATLVAFAKATTECSWNEETTKGKLVPDPLRGKSTMVVNNAKFAIGLGKKLYYGDGAAMLTKEVDTDEISDLLLMDKDLYMIMGKKVFKTPLTTLSPIEAAVTSARQATSLIEVETKPVVANGAAINIDDRNISTQDVDITAVASDGTTVLGVGKKGNDLKSAILTKNKDGKYEYAKVDDKVTHTGGLLISGDNVLAGDATVKSIMKANKTLKTVSTLEDAAVKEEYIHHLGGYEKMVFGLTKEGTKVVVSENYGNKGSWTAVETPKDDKKVNMKFEALSVDPTKKAVYALVKKVVDSVTEYKLMKGECKVKKPSAAYSKALMGPLAISAVALFGAFL